MQKQITEFIKYNPAERRLLNKERIVLFNKVMQINNEMEMLREKKFKLVKKIEELKKRRWKNENTTKRN